MLETIDAWDKSFVETVNQWHTVFGDVLMYWTSETITWIPFYALLVLLLAKNYGWQTLYILVAVALVTTIADQFTSSFMKPFFERFRPCHSPDLQGLALPAGCGGQYGFASSHAANTFGLAMFIFLAFRKHYPYVWLMFVWSGFVSFSRIYLAAHYLTDVLVGGLVGILAASLVWYLLNRLVTMRLKKAF